MDDFQFPQLIGLYSPVPQSGKTTLAEHAESLYGYKRMSHAEPLKAMVDVLLSDYVGLDDKELATSRGPGKDRLLRDIGYSRRRIERALGCGLREHLSPWFWSDLAIMRAQDHAKPVVIDDVRFPNEYTAIKRAGGFVARVVRPDSPCWHMEDYESESLLEDFDFDADLVNEGDVARLFSEFGEFMDAHSKAVF